MTADTPQAAVDGAVVGNYDLAAQPEFGPQSRQRLEGVADAVRQAVNFIEAGHDNADVGLLESDPFGNREAILIELHRPPPRRSIAPPLGLC